MWINVKSINQVSWSVVHVLSWWLYEQCKLYNFVHDVNQCIFIRPRYLFTLNRHTCSITITYYFNMFRFITLFIDFCPVVRSRKQQSQCDGTGRLGLDRVARIPMFTTSEAEKLGLWQAGRCVVLVKHCSIATSLCDCTCVELIISAFCINTEHHNSIHAKSQRQVHPNLVLVSSNSYRKHHASLTFFTTTRHLYFCRKSRTYHAVAYTDIVRFETHATVLHIVVYTPVQASLRMRSLDA